MRRPPRNVESITHKVAALGRVVDRLGAYLRHLNTLSEDKSLKAADRQKMKGYALKWRDAKIIMGCAYFHDLLKSASFLCKSLQADEVCVVTAVEAILKTANSLQKLKTTCFEELPTVSKVLSRITHDGSSSSY